MRVRYYHWPEQKKRSWVLYHRTHVWSISWRWGRDYFWSIEIRR